MNPISIEIRVPLKSEFDAYKVKTSMFMDVIFFKTTYLWTYFLLHRSSINANVGLSVSDSRDTFSQKREEKREISLF